MLSISKLNMEMIELLIVNEADINDSENIYESSRLTLVSGRKKQGHCYFLILHLNAYLIDMPDCHNFQFRTLHSVQNDILLPELTVYLAGCAMQTSRKFNFPKKKNCQENHSSLLARYQGHWQRWFSI